MSELYDEFFAESPEGEGYELSQGSSKSLIPSPQKASKSPSLSPDSSIQKGLESFKERVEEVRKSIQRAESRSISPRVGHIQTTVIVYRDGKVLENPSSYEEGDLVEVPTGL